MEIYLMQHGDCLTEEEDPKQPLSAEGRQKIEKISKAFERMGLAVGKIVTSPKERARQTAEIVAPAVGVSGDAILETELVKAMTPPALTVKYIEQLAQFGSVLVVGHLPSLAGVASFLLTEGAGAAIQFERGGLGRIDVENLSTHEGRLRWYITAGILELIAGD